MQTDVITTQYKKLCSASGRRGYIQIQVLGAGTLYYGSSPSEIQPFNGSQQGFQIVSADKIQRIWIDDEFWVVASVATQIVWDVAFF